MKMRKEYAKQGYISMRQKKEDEEEELDDEIDS